MLLEKIELHRVVTKSDGRDCIVDATKFAAAKSSFTNLEQVLLAHTHVASHIIFRTREYGGWFAGTATWSVQCNNAMTICGA